MSQGAAAVTSTGVALWLVEGTANGSSTAVARVEQAKQTLITVPEDDEAVQVPEDDHRMVVNE
jgi:hypothetical protein